MLYIVSKKMFLVRDNLGIFFNRYILVEFLKPFQKKSNYDIWMFFGINWIYRSSDIVLKNIFFQKNFGEHQRGGSLKLRLNFRICYFEPQQQIKFTDFFYHLVGAQLKSFARARAATLLKIYLNIK